MADNILDVDREVLLGLLAEKIGCRRSEVTFLFGENTMDDDAFTIPKFSESLLKPVVNPMETRKDY